MGKRSKSEESIASPADDYASQTLSLMFSEGIGMDATITCRGHVFPVHKSLAAVRSPVMRAAFYGPFKEASTAELSADLFEPDTIRRLVEHLYTGAYEVPPYKPPRKRKRTGAEGIAAHIENFRWPFFPGTVGSMSATNGSDATMPRPASAPKFPTSEAPPAEYASDSLAVAIHAHVHMSNVSDFYKMDRMSDFAIIAIDRVLDQEWDIDSFVDMLKLCWGKPIDQRVRESFAKAAAPRMDELLDSKKFRDLDCFPPILTIVLRKFAAKLKINQEFADGVTHYNPPIPH